MRFRLVGPLPRSTVVVDPYAPNPQDAPLLLHRINTYEVLEDEIERLRETLREIQAELDATRRRSDEGPTLESLANDLRHRIGAALGDRRSAARGEPERAGRGHDAARIPNART
jgi:hypothetical protein